MRYIEEFKEDERVVGHFFCKRKQTLKTRAGKNYYSLKLQDKTGIIDAKVWELKPDIQSFSENDFIKIDGSVQLYNGERQLNITKIRKSDEGEYDPLDYNPVTDKDIDELFNELKALIETVKTPVLNKLLRAFFTDPQIACAFKTSSAAKAMHHSFMGGLLEHSVATARIADFLCGIYKPVNRDLAITGALLHDIGKIFELEPFPSNDYTDDGRLLGHSYIACDLIVKKAADIDKFPAKLLTLLLHCMIAHHGEYIYGAARRPKIIEAYIIHAADDADAKLKSFERALNDDKTSGVWVGYDRCLDRFIRKTEFL